MSRMLRVVVLAGAMTLLGACDKTTAPRTLPSIEDTTFAPQLGVDLSAMTKTSSGLYYRDLAVGTGTPVDTGSKLQVRYAGFLPNGTLFDQTLSSSPPFSFTLGTGKVIKGWDEGLVGMKVGGQRQLVIPPDLGYGGSGSTNIPSDAILVFVITLVGAS